MKKLLIFTGLLAIVFLVGGYMIYKQVDKSGKSVVNILVVPRDATYTINNRKMSGSKIYLKPGQYTIVAQKQGFSTDEHKFTVPVNGTITMLLTPQSTVAKSWAANNAKQYQQAEGKVSEEIDKASKDYSKNNPILSNLPYHSGLYNIDYGDKGGGLVIYVSSPSGAVGRQVALAKMRSWGYDPTDYNIVFTDFSNPFGQTKSGANQ